MNKIVEALRVLCGAADDTKYPHHGPAWDRLWNASVAARAALAEHDAQPAQAAPLSEFQRMQCIGEEFPLALVDPLIIRKIDSVCLLIERAHGIKGE